MKNLITRVLMLAATAVLLSGCFLSERPLFAPETAVAVFGEGGHYLTFENKDGRFEAGETIEARRRADGAYDMVDGKGQTTPASFHAIAGGLHVAQVKADGGKTGYGYSVFRISGSEALVYELDCEAQDPAKLATLGVERRGRYECGLDRVGDPAALFTELKLGGPVSKMVRQ